MGPSGKGGGRGAGSRRDFTGSLYTGRLCPRAWCWRGALLGWQRYGPCLPSRWGWLTNIDESGRWRLRWGYGSPWHVWSTTLVCRMSLRVCVRILSNQQSHNVPLTNLQVVESQRDVAAQKLVEIYNK